MVETMNDIGNRQPDSNAGCSKQKGVKNKQTRQLVLWIDALIVGPSWVCSASAGWMA